MCDLGRKWPKWRRTWCFKQVTWAGARRREFLRAARDGRALLRDTDGFALAMVPLADLEEVSEIGQAALTLLRAESGLRRVDAHESDLGPLAWLLVFDEDDRPVRGGAERCHHAG